MDHVLELPSDPILQLLIDKYPRLFHGSSPRCYSQVTPGWLRLVDALCSYIDGLLTDEQAKVFEVRQIKEKIGSLRFYFGRGEVNRLDESTAALIHIAIEDAVLRSSITCTVCGNPGRGSLDVRCDSHRDSP